MVRSGLTLQTDAYDVSFPATQGATQARRVVGPITQKRTRSKTEFASPSGTIASCTVVRLMEGQKCTRWAGALRALVLLALVAPTAVASPAFEGECSDEQLFAWARQHGVDIDNVVLGEFAFESPMAGGETWLARVRKRRGLMAAVPMKRGDVVLSVPEEVLFSVAAANKTELSEIIGQFSLDSYAILALFLLQETNKGHSSRYWPYLCQMPSSFQTTPYWPMSQILQAGNTSNLYLQTRRLQVALQQEYNRLIPMLTHLFPAHVNPATHSFRRWVWAKTCVFSRNWVSKGSQFCAHT